MPTNKEDFAKFNGYRDIVVNDEATNVFNIIQFTSVPYTLQKYVESDSNKLASGELVCNAIYTSSGWPK